VDSGGAGAGSGRVADGGSDVGVRSGGATCQGRESWSTLATVFCATAARYSLRGLEAHQNIVPVYFVLLQNIFMFDYLYSAYYAMMVIADFSFS
jgi:hypothetical protein